jgi:hypothetical protein
VSKALFQMVGDINGELRTKRRQTSISKPKVIQTQQPVKKFKVASCTRFYICGKGQL